MSTRDATRMHIIFVLKIPLKYDKQAQQMYASAEKTGLSCQIFDYF